MKIITKGMKITLIIMNIIILTGCMKNSNSNTSYAPGDDKQLIIYTSHKREVYRPIIKEFEERTGIWVQVKDGGTNELLEDIAAFSENSLCDIMFGGGVENLEAYSEYFEPYRCKESDSLDDTYVSANDSWTAFSALPIVIIYNNKLVYEKNAPTGWEDLLNEKWKGKIAFADPSTSGSSYTTLATMVQVIPDEMDNTLKRFVSMLDGHVLSGSGEVIDAVAKGTRLVGITLEETAMKRIASGADITMVYPVEGTSSVPDGSALLKNAPHEGNAKLFLDFIVSKDVQRFIVDELYRRSIRSDISNSKEYFQEINIIDYDFDWASSNQNEVLKRWSELVQ